MTTSDGDALVSSAVVVLSATIVVAACCCHSDRTLACIVIPIPISLGSLLLAGQWPDDLPALAAMVAVASVAATGIAMLRTGFTRVDALALALGSNAATIALFSTPTGVSLAATMLAVQTWIYGVAFRRIELAVGAASAGALGFLSLWWTTGTNEIVIDWIAPYGASGQDVALGATALALLGGGAALRAVQRSSTWLAYSPGLSFAFAWLLVAQSDGAADWSTLGGLVLGVVAVGVGGARRLAAPLVIGTVGLTVTGIVSIGERLTAAPTWTWIAVGGVGLLAVAALLERSERPLLPERPSPKVSAEFHSEPTESVTALFARTFE